MNCQGDLIFVQIKTGYVSANPGEDCELRLGADHVREHLARWFSYPGPAVVSNVIPRRLTKGEPLQKWLSSDAAATEPLAGEPRIADHRLGWGVLAGVGQRRRARTAGA